MVKNKVLFAVACFTLTDLKTVECKAYCKFHAGYDSGLYSQKRNRCYCVDEIDPERMEEKRIILPNKIRKTRSVATREHRPESIPYRLPWEIDEE